jgi:protein-S-isoprenylcysteine O-methyltransferase Ste14
MSTYDSILYGFVVLALFTMPYLFRTTAPYGRHSRGGFGPRINATLGWLLMEMPASLVPLALFLLSDPGHRENPVGIAFLALWQLHYVHRAFIFPFRRRGGAPMPLLIPLSAILFNVGNAYLNWHYLTVLHAPYAASWFGDPRFLLGLLMFLGGFAINQHSDWILLHLRRPGETGYKIPYGGLYRWVSCPNYLGELIEWTGWDILTWSLPGAVFALWTAANLVPRALAHHRDYQRRFSQYPSERRAVLPYLL